MADNVNIIVQDTINDIVVNAAVVVETIDINVQAAVDVVDIVANPNNYVVNINRIIGEQVQSDWTQTDNQAPDYIKNKPTIPTATSDLTNDGEDGINPFITAADVTPQVNSDWDATSGVAEILNKPTIPAAVTKTSDLTNDGENGVDPFITAADVPASVTSVGLTMPSAFSVANSPITSAGTLEVTGAGVVSQYVRGDGSLANFPTSTGGGASLSFYLNGSVSQGTIGGVAFREMDRTPILGAGTDFTIAANGYIQSFITDANVPNLLEIPAGNWNFETYFSASSGGGSPSFYVELYKWNGTTLSLIASNSATPEGITNGTAIDLYVSALAVPQTTLLATDRLAIRIYVTHSGRTIKLHTEDNHLCQVITTFSTGITALNGLTTQVQSFATGTSGTDFGISSATSTHTFNLPTASAANRGALSSTDWSTFNGKQAALVSGTNIKTINGASVLGSGDLVVGGSNIYNANGTLTGNRTLTSGGFPLTFTGSNTAASAIARGLHLNHILVAAANNDVLVGLDLQPTFTNGAFTGTSNFGLRIEQGTKNGNNTGNIVFKRTDVANFATIGYQGLGWNIFGIWGEGTITSTNAPDIGVFAGTGVAYIKNKLLINTNSDAGFRLDVNGTARVNNNLSVATASTSFSGLTVGGAASQNHITIDSTQNAELRFHLNGGMKCILRQFSNEFRFYNTSGAILANWHVVNNNFVFSNTTIGPVADTSSVMEIRSTDRGFLPPRMTTTQKNAIAAPAAGLVVYDTTLNKLCLRTAAAWETITSI